MEKIDRILTSKFSIFPLPAQSMAAFVFLKTAQYDRRRNRVRKASSFERSNTGRLTLPSPLLNPQHSQAPCTQCPVLGQQRVCFHSHRHVLTVQLSRPVVATDVSKRLERPRGQRYMNANPQSVRTQSSPQPACLLKRVYCETTFPCWIVWRMPSAMHAVTRRLAGIGALLSSLEK